MHSKLRHEIREAIRLYNQEFLGLKKINSDFINLFINTAVQVEEERKHLEESNRLLEAIKAIQGEIESKRGVQNHENYYGLVDASDGVGILVPKTEMDGFLVDALRAYFVHVLKIPIDNNLFNVGGQHYFDFKLDHLLDGNDLADSLEVRHTRDWALIGQALALKEIQRKTKKKGRKKRYDASNQKRDIDIKRAEFADNVHNHFYEQQGAGEDFAAITDLEIITIYRQMLTEQQSPDGIDLAELEQHIKLKNISDSAACNSISNGRREQEL